MPDPNPFVPISTDWPETVPLAVHQALQEEHREALILLGRLSAMIEDAVSPAPETQVPTNA